MAIEEEGGQQQQRRVGMEKWGLQDAPVAGLGLTLLDGKTLLGTA
jgi:hypothetical protein